MADNFTSKSGETLNSFLMIEIFASLRYFCVSQILRTWRNTDKSFSKPLSVSPSPAGHSYQCLTYKHCKIFEQQQSQEPTVHSICKH